MVKWIGKSSASFREHREFYRIDIIPSEHLGQTLQATDLVHEAYHRLVDADSGDAAKWNSTGHFFGAAAIRELTAEELATCCTSRTLSAEQ